MPETATKPRTKVKTKTERPRLHKVILVNDDFTPREFVVTVLKAEFRMTEDQAHKVMITAHRLAAFAWSRSSPKDVAETKATRATDAGRAKGYPLVVHHRTGRVMSLLSGQFHAAQHPPERISSITRLRRRFIRQAVDALGFREALRSETRPGQVQPPSQIPGEFRSDATTMR